MISKKTFALLCLLGFGLSLAYAINDYPQQKSLPTGAADQPQASNSEENGTKPPSLKTTQIVKEELRYNGFQTDLFRPLFDKPPIIQSQKPKNPVPKKKSAPLALPPAPTVAVIQSPPPVARRLASFTYLGQVSEAGKRSIFLKEKGRIFIVHKGDVFGEKKEFCLIQITEKEIQIKVDEMSEVIRIPLEKTKPLTLAATGSSKNRTARHAPPRNSAKTY